MKGLRVLTTIAVVLSAALFVRLGVWQLSRLGEKRAANADLRAALAAAPTPLSTLSPTSPPALAALRGRRLIAEGAYDSTRLVMVSDRWRGDIAGIELYTPLRVAGGGAVWVDRGWLPADDAIDGHAERVASGGPQRVVALAEPLPRGGKGAAWKALARPGGGPVFSTQALDADTVAARVPYAVAGYVLRALPAPGDTSLPRREAPEPLNESMHLGYAIQWFAMATIVVVGSLVAMFRARRRAS